MTSQPRIHHLRIALAIAIPAPDEAGATRLLLGPGDIIRARLDGWEAGRSVRVQEITGRISQGDDVVISRTDPGDARTWNGTVEAPRDKDGNLVIRLR